MSPEEVRIVLRRRDDQLSFKPQLTADDEAFRAAHVATYLKGASLQWALGYVMEQAMTGSVPTDAELMAAWREHKEASLPPEVRARLQAPVPDAPVAVQRDGARWVRWNRARLEALLDGADTAASVAAANAAVGASPDPAPDPELVARGRALFAQARARHAARRLDGEVAS